jgi:hypothetical protein
MSESNPSAVRRARGITHTACAAVLAFVAAAPAAARDDITMEVAWTDERCDFIVMRNEHGHGIAMRLTPLKLREGDKLRGALDEIGFGRKIAKLGTDDGAMMQVRKYGIRRKIALDFVYEWSRQCNPPEE